jgi:hypothetical protein
MPVMNDSSIISEPFFVTQYVWGTGGDDMVAVFTSRERAARAAEIIQKIEAFPGVSSSVRAMSVLELFGWLRDHEARGVRWLTVNPKCDRKTGELEGQVLILPDLLQTGRTLDLLNTIDEIVREIEIAGESESQ